MKKKFTVLTLLLIAATAACEGPMGPQGPAGPQGPQGNQGAKGEKGDPGDGAVALSATGTIPSDGSVVVRARNTDIRQVAINCWIGQVGDDGNIIWLLVALHSESSCGATQDESDLLIVLLGPSNWRYLIVAVRVGPDADENMVDEFKRITGEDPPN